MLFLLLVSNAITDYETSTIWLTFMKTTYLLHQALIPSFTVGVSSGEAKQMKLMSDTPLKALNSTDGDFYPNIKRIFFSPSQSQVQCKHSVS